MPLDSLGLGLTLDTTLLEKADKTLENMHKNSKLIMQNLTRGISAFDDGKIKNFSSTIKHISDSLDKISKTTVSPDFDTRGLAKGVGYVTELVSEIEKMQKAGTKQFFNTDALYTTKVSVTETAMALKNLRDEADRVDTAIRVFLQFPDLIDASKKRVQELRDALKSINKKQNPEQHAATTVELDAERKKLQGLKDTLAEVKKEYGNLNNARLKSKQIIEQIAIAEDLHSWTSKTKAEQLAAITSYNNKIIAEERARTKEVETLYKNNFAEMQRISKSIAQLEADREKIAKGGGDTTEQDMNLAFYRDQLQKRRDLEVEIASSGYQKIAKIKKELNAEAFLDESKQQVKNLETEVSFANRFSKNAKSVEEEKEAIELLRSARNNLSQDTAHYSQIVEALNKRILSHKDHIEAVTREEKEQNTLADSVINRYRKQLKELDELNEALDELAKKQQSTGAPYTAEEAKARIDLTDRRDTVQKDILEIEKNAQGQLDVIREQHDAERAKKKVDSILKENEREKQEYAKLLDDLYAIEKQKKAMEDAGGGLGDKGYSELLVQEQELKNKKQQLELKHQNDLAEIRKKHDKKRNDDEVKAFIDAQKEKQKIAEEYAKKQREKAKKYGTISSSSVDRLIGVTDNANNINQHKAAIEKLTQARASLNNTDKDYLKTIKKLNDAIKYHEIEIELADEKSKNLMQTHRGLMDIGGQLMRRLALVFSVSQLTQYFRKLVEVRGEFEKTEVALTTILKSRAQANVLMNQITDLAIKSPFTLQQLVGYTKQLAAYQIEYKKLYSTTKMLADVSAGLGVEMDRLILAFGQVRAANFLRATEVRQFTEAGFDILGELAKHYSELKGEMVSVGEVQEMVTKRMVGFADVEKVFQKVTSAGGIFYDMQAKQAVTLAGQ
jgi:DNA repair exonuclease SbcCD ATPase subunit